MSCHESDIFSIILSITITSSLSAQEQISDTDSSDILEQVVVKGYEYNRKLINVPAPIAVISKAQFNRFNNISLLPALNTVTGVRMEKPYGQLSFKHSRQLAAFTVRCEECESVL